ncbi:hypothetical protein IAR50_005302 [Cryptococcus sp. DSM 104548]
MFSHVTGVVKIRPLWQWAAIPTQYLPLSDDVDPIDCLHGRVHPPIKKRLRDGKDGEFRQEDKAETPIGVEYAAPPSVIEPHFQRIRASQDYNLMLKAGSQSKLNFTCTTEVWETIGGTMRTFRTHSSALTDVVSCSLSAFKGEYAYLHSKNEKYIRDLVAVVMESAVAPGPLTKTLHPVIRCISGLEREAIIAAYSRLHNIGILHHNVWAGHVTKQPYDDKPRILDFDGAEYVSKSDRVIRALEFEAEMAKVKRMVGSQD